MSETTFCGMCNSRHDRGAERWRPSRETTPEKVRKDERARRELNDAIRNRPDIGDSIEDVGD